MSKPPAKTTLLALLVGAFFALLVVGKIKHRRAPEIAE